MSHDQDKAILKLVNLPSNEIREVEVEGVDQDDIDQIQETASNIYRMIRFNAEDDISLSKDECNEFENDSVIPDQHKLVAERLKVISREVVNKIKKDKKIERADDVVINDVVQDASKNEKNSEDEGVDSPGRSLPFRYYEKIKKHLLGVLGDMFSYEELLNVDSPGGLVVKFAVVANYCFNFCTRLLLRAKKILKSILPSVVFDILSSVTSILFQHLVKIGWKTLVDNAGGWVQLIGSLTIRKATHYCLQAAGSQVLARMGGGGTLWRPSTFFGIAVISTVVGMYTYYSNA